MDFWGNVMYSSLSLLWLSWNNKIVWIKILISTTEFRLAISVVFNDFTSQTVCN